MSSKKALNYFAQKCPESFTTITAARLRKEIFGVDVASLFRCSKSLRAAIERLKDFFLFASETKLTCVYFFDNENFSMIESCKIQRKKTTPSWAKKATQTCKEMLEKNAARCCSVSAAEITINRSIAKNETTQIFCWGGSSIGFGHENVFVGFDRKRGEMTRFSVRVATKNMNLSSFEFVRTVVLFSSLYSPPRPLTNDQMEKHRIPNSAGWTNANRDAARQYSGR